MEAGPPKTSGSGKRNTSAMDNVPLERPEVSATGSSPDRSLTQSLDTSNSVSQCTRSTSGGLSGGLSFTGSGVRKASVTDSMPVGSVSMVAVRNNSIVGLFDVSGPKSPDAFGIGSKNISTNQGQYETRVRRGSDVIDSFGLGSPSSPASLSQRSPVFRYETLSSRSSYSSQDAAESPVSPIFDQSRRWSSDLVEYPLAPELAQLHLEAVPEVKYSDVTDAAESRRHTEGEFGEVEPLETTEKVEALMTVEPGDEEYPMGLPHRRRGVAAIFNNDRFNSEPERKGSAADVRVLQRSLSSLGFQVDVHPNLTRRQIGEELDKLVNADHDDCECFCLVVLTHGEAPELLHAKDGVYQQRELWTPFTGENCPKLAGKPKIFLIQACRGEGLDRGVRLVKYSNSSQTDSSSSSWSYVIPVWADFLIAHSSVQGFYSWRDLEDGTWWIQTLCQELESRGATTDLLKILTIVNRRVALEFESSVLTRPDQSGCKEIPSFTSTLMRDLYFRPRPISDQVKAEPPS